MDKIKHVMKLISTDLENDIKELDGMPFNGKVVAEAFGKQAAAIQALTKAVERLAEAMEKLQKAEADAQLRY